MFFKKYHSMNDTEWHTLWDLYCTSFPIHERRTLTDHAQAMQDPAFTCAGIWDNKTFLGLLFYWTYADECYIEHFAIDEKQRGKNIGSKCLQAFLEDHPAVILEIDMPVTDIAKRRKLFYERLGFAASEQVHLHPAYRKDADPHQLMILRYPQACSEAMYAAFCDFLETRVMRYSEKFNLSL